MGFVEALEPRDQNRQDETFVDDLNGGASRDGFCIEMNELSSQDTTSTGMRDEIVLLAWALVLMRRKEGALPRFEWAHLAEGKPVINQLPTEEVFPSLQLTTRKVAASILQLIQNATRTKHVPGASALLLSSNSLSKDSEVTKNEETKHIEIRFSAGQIQIRTIWCSVNTLPHTVAHTIRTFVDTIRACIANPEETIEQALQATESDFDEIWRLCHELPPTHRFCMHEKISERARRLDEKVGISSWDGDLTYWQIDQWSSHFAGLLKNRVQPQDVVPICFEKSRWTVIALLATMKAGATFVLMDPTLPLARLQNMAKQVGAKAMVSSRKQFELASSILPAEKILVVERQAFKAIERTWEIAELPKVDPSTLMYIIFTSGSTGTPKGVQISHETYTSSAIPRAKAVGYTEESRVLDFASYAFDVSIDSMLLTLGNGGCLCIPSDEDRMNDINGVIRNMNINYAGLTPSVGRILDPDVIRSLTGGLGLGGEAVSARDATVWGKDARIVIGYGPCECTIGCTVNSSAATGRDYVSIGPGNGAVIWIVDPNDHTVLMPVGAVGELLVEGPIVGQGYLNDPEKTASAFINDPPWLLAGHKQYAGRSGRLYKTGDLGKYDPDGSGGIVFAGRKDTQVKLRGQRVELGEIESQLRERLPADVNIIAEVIAPQGASGQPTLVAFVTCPAMKSGVGISIATPPDELSTVLSTVNVELSKAVPRYMVPTAYIPVNNIPVLISGKTDRKQLRQFGNGIELRELSKGGNPSIFRKLNKLEERMRQAWSTVLKLDVGKIQPEDNFFALGGDSLAAMKLVSASRSQGLDLSVMSMFANPSLSEMASVTQPFDSESQPEVVPFSLLSQSSESAVQEASETYGFAPSAIEDIYPCTPTQESLFTFSLKSEKPYIAQRVASIPSHIHTETWKSAWERVVSEIPILRTRLAQLQEPGLQQVILKSKVAWKDSINLDQYLTADKAMRMNLGDDLARYAIVHAQDGKRYMVWTIHHIVYDGWSEPVILRQVCHALKDEPLEIMTQMRDFVKYVKDTDESAMQEFWRRELKGAIGPQFPRLPSRDFLPNPDGLVEGDITVGISPGYPFTMATLIRGAWALVASQYSGNDDVVFGETLTGRDISLLGVEGIIGPLIATVPVRVRAQRSMSIEAFLRSVQQGALARTPYQHMGMQNIRKVSYDAQHACEAPTGLVIQPEPDFGGSELGFEIGDVVLEALHFNPYPLMIGTQIRKGGFRICANFDSSLVQVSQMRRVLAQMQEACTQLTQDLSRPLGNVSFVSEIELDQIWEWNETPPLSFDQGSSTLRSGENTKSGENYPRAVIPWVCDPRNPCILSPIGCLGELWLEGNCLPGKTESSKWLEKGSSSFPGRIGKLQSTGDIVTQKENGSITFVGKKESIFVQGHAVNTAELDIHLARYLPPTVRAATGMLSPSKDEKQQDHIVFLQSNSAKEKHTEIIPTSREMDLPNQKIHFSSSAPSSLCVALKKLDKFIQDSLPSYMTPSAYVVVDNLFNTMGDVSQKQLNIIASAIPQDILTEFRDGFKKAWESTSANANLTPKERILRAAWARVLKMKEEKIDLDDNFFRLGGDSVLAMKLVSSLRMQGHDLSVANVFQHMRLVDAAQAMKLDQTPEHVTEEYRPFSTLHDVDVDLFVSRVVRPSLANAEWNIQDVLPVSSSQAMDIKATIQAPKTSIQYTMLSFDQGIVREQLFDACRRLMDSHQILRTVFIEHESKFYQVVLDKVEPIITKHVGGEDLEQSTKEICKAHAELDYVLGSPFFRVLHIEGRDGRECLVLGLSHAQYDGVSLPNLLQDFETLYTGGSIVGSKPFSEYIAWTCDKRVKKTAIDYWSALLRGATLSGLSGLQGPTVKPTDQGIFQTKTVEDFYGSDYITTANLVTAAWALILARRLQKPDITFGGVTSGRTVDLPGVEKVVGPCYQLTPIRVTFESHWSGIDLLEYVQKQAAESASYDFLGFDSIVKHCTSWSSSQFYDSIVHHQDWDDFDTMPFAGGSCKVDILNPYGDSPYPLKIVSFVKEGQVNVGVVGSENDLLFIDSVLDELTSTVRELADMQPGVLLDAQLF